MSFPFVSCNENFAGNSQDALAAGKHCKRTKKQKELPPITQTAKVKTLAETDKSTSSRDDVSDAIFDRIKKCLERAKHPNTPELETKAAFRLANRLMSQYNVTHSDVQSHETENEDSAPVAGQSTVSITTIKERAVNQSFVHAVARAMNTFFDCKCYSSDCYTTYEWTFYGIAANTVVAAMAFETAHNVILEWGRSKGKYKASYYLGAGEGLASIARSEKAKEEQQAKESEKREVDARLKEEEAQRQREIDRLNGPPESTPENDERLLNGGTPGDCHPSKSETDVSSQHEDTAHDFGSCGYDSDESDDSIDISPNGMQPTFKQEEETQLAWDIDVDEELQKMVQQASKNEEHSFKLKEEDDDEQGGMGLNSFPETALAVKAEVGSVEPQSENMSLWKTHAQLILFRKSATKIAEDYAKENFKLTFRKDKRSLNIDTDTYNQGWRDSKRIDFKRRRLE